MTTPLTVNGPQDYTAVYTTAASLPPIPGFPLESILVGTMAGLLALAFVRECNRKRMERSDRDIAATI